MHMNTHTISGIHPSSPEALTVKSGMDASEREEVRYAGFRSRAKDAQSRGPGRGAHELHRHWVVAPVLVVALLSTSLGVHAQNIRASIVGDTVVEDDMEIVASPDGTRALPDSGAQLTSEGGQLRLEEGGAIIAGPGSVRISFGDIVASAFAGAFYAVKHGEIVTVVALDVPVILETNGRFFLIPVSMQWRGASSVPVAPTEELLQLPQRVPRDFLEEKLTAIPDALRSVEGILPSARSAPPSSIDIASSFRLPLAEKRMQEERTGALFGYLRWLVEEADVEGVSALFADPQYSESIAQSALRWRILPPLAADAADSAPIMTHLLPILLEDSTFLIVASLHPTLRSHTWTQISPSETPDAASQFRILAFPAADTLPEATPAFVVERWAEEVKGFLAATTDRPAFLTSLIRITAFALRTFDDQGYPERAQRYVQTLLSLTEPYADSLSSDDRETLDALRARDQVSIDRVSPPPPAAVEIVPSAEVSEEQIPQSHLSPEAVESETYSAMRDAGALFTVQTTIAAGAPGTATVKGILFATADGERSFDFLYNAETGDILELTMEGKTFPFDLTIGKFREWLAGGVK
ncbi:MAG: hypothetical protein Q7R81_00480 [Candidatus Peregrinibacteria bacterium]|nr:hypothetical protein [Candidatus Peregrinibacteria bacterium]